MNVIISNNKIRTEDIIHSFASWLSKEVLIFEVRKREGRAPA